MTRSRAYAVALVAAVAIAATTQAAAQPRTATAPTGQLTWGVHTTLAPTWFDPAETSGIITPFMVLYALHDALVKPMPGNAMTPSLAESWSASKDGLSYEFVLRKGVKFHNGDVMTAEDVKFSFERYRGASSTDLKAKVARVEVLDPHRVRFILKRPWPDFMTFYATPATGAAWIVPKKYVEKVGEDGFKKAPVGAGPYRFVSFKPGVELTLEAFDGYWRKTPSVKTLLFRVIPDESTRLAALKRGEVDIAYSITGPLAEELKRTPGLTLTPTFFPFTIWIWAPPPYPYDPKRAKQLLAEAGYPNGFDAADFSAEAVYGAAIGEPVVNYLQAVGIRLKLRLLERAAFYQELGEKKLRPVVQNGSGAPGNAPTRIEVNAVTGGRYAYGAYPDIDGLFSEQANEMNPRVRQQLLFKIQEMIHERVMFGPVIEPAFLNGVGPRPAVSGLGLIKNHAYSAPYEDLKLKPRP